ANLDGANLHHLSGDALMDLMRGRAVLTAQAHLKHGPRRDAFLALLPEDVRDTFEQRLAALAGLQVPGEVVRTLRPWMNEWASHPYGPASGSRRFGQPAAKQGDRSLSPDVDSAPPQKTVDYLTSLYADDVLGKLREVVPSPGAAVEKVVRVLAFS